MQLIKSLSNLPGWRTDRKLIVIESDDWGSLRAPSGKGFQKMKALKLPLGGKDGIRFNIYDDLAGKEDFERLFEVLEAQNDKFNNPAVITALSVVANPDFEKIKKNNFYNYYYVSLLDSLKMKQRESAWQLWKEGYKRGIFIPQFHGREHLNVGVWMRALRNNDSMTLEGFKHHFWGFRHKANSVSYQAAFDLQLAKDLEEQIDILKNGLQLFEKIHERKANFFVPPNGAINNKLESVAAECGIKYMATPKIQTEVLGSGKTKKHFRYLGLKNKYGQIYMTRNAFFEPSSPRKTDWVDACMHDIKIAFKFRKPATISSHRLNYIGVNDASYREKNLAELNRLLCLILKTWPEVEFVSSSKLGDIINSKQQGF